MKSNSSSSTYSRWMAQHLNGVTVCELTCATKMSDFSVFVVLFSREDFLRIPELAINPLSDRIVQAFFVQNIEENSVS